jgi:hypothetical protein
MSWRTQGSTDRPNTPWDDMLLEMSWLREDFKCDAERKKILMGEVAKRWDDGNRQRLRSIWSNLEEAKSGEVVRRKSTISDWARDEYLGQRILANDHGPESTSEGEDASKLNHASCSSEPLLSEGKRKAETIVEGRRSKRLRNLADATK